MEDCQGDPGTGNNSQPPKGQGPQELIQALSRMDITVGAHQTVGLEASAV